MRRFTCAVLALLAFTSGMKAEPTTLRIATGEYAPFTGENLPDHGVVNARVRHLMEAAGYNVEFHYMPWKRTLESTRRNAFDATSYWSYSREREGDFIHVGPVLRDPLIFLVREDAPIRDWSELEDLSGLRIGVVPGYTYSEELWALGESGVLTLSEATSDEANLKKLLSGRIDIFPTNEVVGWHMIREIFSEEDQAQFRALMTPLNMWEGYVLVPRIAPGSESLAEALQSVVDSGRIQLTN